MKMKTLALRIFALLAVATTASTFVGTVQPALASDGIITTLGVARLEPNTSDQQPFNLEISDFNSTDVLSVSVLLVASPADTTFRLPNTGLTPAYGYSFSNQLQAISFTGTKSATNAALADLLVSTGLIGGQLTLRLAASLRQSNTYYNPINEHFYQYVSSPNISWVNARSSAQTRTLNGATGYLATITSEEENDFIAQKINAANIWIGASDNATEGNWTWADGPEAGLNFWQGTARGSSPSGTSWYSHWAINQPDDSNGNEDFAVTNWRGTLGQWNDVAENGANLVSGYLTEFDSGVGGYTEFYSGEFSGVIGYPPLNVNVQAGNEEVAVTWDAPAGVTATNYTVTASPDGAQCTVTGSSPTGNTCTVTGLNPGTEYTFTVTAFYPGGSTASISASATPTASSTTSTSTAPSTNLSPTSAPITLPATGAQDHGQGAIVALWLLVAGFGTITAVRRRRQI
jgi:hypothetical protein